VSLQTEEALSKGIFPESDWRTIDLRPFHNASGNMEAVKTF